MNTARYAVPAVSRNIATGPRYKRVVLRSLGYWWLFFVAMCAGDCLFGWAFTYDTGIESATDEYISHLVGVSVGDLKRNPSMY